MILKSKQVLRFSHGLRFRKPWAYIGFFGCLAIFALATIVLADEKLTLLWPRWLAIGILFLVFLGLFLESEGVEMDLNANKIRKYNSTFGIKEGVWVSLNQYQKLELIGDSFTVSEGGFTLAQNNRIAARSFFIFLQQKDPTKPLQVAEYFDYNEAKSELKNLASVLDLPVNNLHEEKTRSALKRRMERDGR